MNIFLIAWNCNQNDIDRSKTAVKHSFRYFPNIDANTFWSYGKGDPVYLLNVHNAYDVVTPRLYRHEDDAAITFFDGCLVDSRNEFTASNAQSLNNNWHSLIDRLEGQFVVCRYNKSQKSMEIFNDFLGVYPVFFTRRGDTWFISNNVGVLSKIRGDCSFSPEGVNSFLGFGWACGNSTLQKDIFALPAGQNWVFKPESREPVKNTYYGLNNLLAAKNADHQLGDITSKLSTNIKVLHQDYQLLEAPITAGRDSRAIVSLLHGNNVAAEYFTSGQDDSIDVIIASKIASQYGFTHRINQDSITNEDVISNWDEAMQRALHYNDGMVSLAHINNAVRSAPSISNLWIHFYGAGGEIARQFYEDDGFYAHRHTYAYVHRYLNRKLVRARNLYQADVAKYCQNFLADFIHQVQDSGFSLADTPALFYAYERTRRWAGANFRQVISHRDVFSPFCSRPFVEAAFSISLLDRYAETLHYKIMHSLTPGLLGIEFEKNMHPQSRMLNRAGIYKNILANKLTRSLKLHKYRKSSAKVSSSSQRLERSVWFEAKRQEIREFCLDQSSSELWNYVDRNMFELLMKNENQLSERRKNIQALYDIITLFYYEQTMKD